jgi:hypothetical protein
MTCHLICQFGLIATKVSISILICNCNWEFPTYFHSIIYITTFLLAIVILRYKLYIEKKLTSLNFLGLWLVKMRVQDFFREGERLVQSEKKVAIFEKFVKNSMDLLH